MADRHTLAETEHATRDRVQPLQLDVEASHALLSLYRAANAVRVRLTNRVLRPHELTWTSFLVLWNLWISIERHAGTTDRRLVHLQLSQAGVELMERIYPELNEAESEVVADLSPEDLCTTTSSRRQLVETAELLNGAS